MRKNIIFILFFLAFFIALVSSTNVTRDSSGSGTFIARQDTAINDAPPPTNSLPPSVTSNLSVSEYSQISSLNGVNDTLSVPDDSEAYLFFNASANFNSILSLNWSWNGDWDENNPPSNVGNVSFYIWNFSSSSWYQCTTQVSDDQSATKSCYLNRTNDLTNFVNVNSYFLVFAEDPNDGDGVANTMRTDYVKLDITYLNVTLVSPANNSNIASPSQTFVCDMSGLSLQNSTLYIWNSTNSLIHTNSTNVSGSSNSTTFGFSMPYEDSFKWNCLVSDSNLNSFADSNFTLTMDTIAPQVTINRPTPQQNLSGSVQFNITLNENGLCRYSLNSGVNNVSMTNSGNRDFTHTNSSIADGTYIMNAYCNDTAGSNNSTQNVTFSMDSTFPLISYQGDTESDNANLSRTNIYVNVSVTETNFANITFSLYNLTGVVNSTIFTTLTTTINWTSLLDTNYTFQVNITDSANNKNATLTRRVLIDTTNPLISYGTGTQNNFVNISASNVYVNVSVTELNEKETVFTLYNESAFTGNLLTWWAFDRNLSLQVDSSGNTNNAQTTIVASPNVKFTNSGMLNGAFEFDGDGDYLEAVTNSTYDLNGSATYTVWIKPKLNTTDTQRVLSKSNSGPTTFGGFSIQFPSTRKATCQIANVSGTSLLVASSTDLTIDQWYHVGCIIRRSGNTINVSTYINGVEESSGQTTLSGEIYNSTRPLRIGVPASSQTFGEFNGTIDEVMIWTTNLSTSQIQDIYNSRIVNRTTFTTSTRRINWTSLADNDYHYNVYIIDRANNQNTTATRDIRLDDTPPSLTLVIPAEGQEFATNISLALNFSVSDTGVGLGSCWFNIDNSANTTITNCANTTFNTSEGAHTLYVFANDTLNNLAQDSNSFTISLSAPAITLNYPSNNTYFASGNNIYLNYTATDSNGIGACEVWHDLNGTFAKNQTNTGVASGQMNFTIFNISVDNRYRWNVFCNDTIGQGRFSSNNFTFTVDTTLPQITINSITQIGQTQTFSFSHTETDSNLNSCWYSVRNSSGGIDPATSENFSIDCNDAGSETVSDFGTFNLTVYANDTAGNINSSTSAFTLNQAGGDGGGGGGPTNVTVIQVVNKTYCGDNICQNPGYGFPKGNDYGKIEDFFTCEIDCPGFNIDSSIFACFTDDPELQCIWNQNLAQYIGLSAGILLLIVSLATVKDEKGRNVTTIRYVYTSISKRRRRRKR